MTGRNPLARFAEHAKSIGTGKDLLDYSVIPGTGTLVRNDARVVEQSLLNRYGLQSNGGTLINKINSISQSSSLYKSVQNLSSSGGGGGGGSSSALVGLYQSLVSKLGSIVSLLTGGHH